MDRSARRQLRSVFQDRQIIVDLFPIATADRFAGAYPDRRARAAVFDNAQREIRNEA